MEEHKAVNAHLSCLGKRAAREAWWSEAKRPDSTFGTSISRVKTCRTGALLWATGVGECPVKKSVGQAPLEQRHVVIEQTCQEKQPMSLRHLCELLQVNRAWYYARKHALVQPSKRAEEVALRDAIEKIILDFSGYGYRRVTHALQRDGWKVNHKHVLRIMREESLLCHLKRHFVHTTDSHHHFPIYPNLVNGRTPDAPDVIWVADITYIRLRHEFLY